MDVLLLVLFGIVQGLTEFIPVSSSGHLVLFKHIFDMQYPGVTLEVAVHGGTLLAVITHYRRDILRIAAALLRGTLDLLRRTSPIRRVLARPDFYTGFTLFIATVVTGIVALLVGDMAVANFENLDFVAVAWIVTGLLLWATRWRNPAGKFIPIGSAILLGLAQAAAIFPGISRSGVTIFAALYLGLSRREAARHSFLLSAPVIAGALLVDLVANRTFLAEPGVATGLIVAVMAAALAGYLALRFVIDKLSRGQLHHFSPYLWLLGTVILLVRGFAA